MEQNYEVKIPNIMNPFTVEVNGESYSFPAGTMQVVNQEVYDVIRNIESMVPTPNPRAGEPSFESLRDRPFGESTEVLFDKRVEILSEWHDIEGALPISDGNLVKVTWNGVEYECTAVAKPDGLVYFGNPVFIDGEDNGIPFMMCTGTFEGRAMFGINAPAFIGQTVSVKVEVTVVKTIAPKFLPGKVVYNYDYDTETVTDVNGNEVTAEQATRDAFNVVVRDMRDSAITYINPNVITIGAGYVYFYLDNAGEELHIAIGEQPK